MPSPFREPATGEAFFRDASAGAAELKLAYAFDEAVEAALLIGDAGLGKTTLLRRLAARAADAGHVVADVFFPRLDVDGLLALLIAELEPDESRTDDGRESRLRRIADHARKLSEQGRGIAILIDDAHLLRDPAIFEALHLLLNLREREHVRLTVFLSGQKSLLADLSRVPALAQRVGITATLVAFDENETAAYVRHRLKAASGPQFDEHALAAVHERSGGVPRLIDRLCEMAILVANAERRDRIGRDEIDSVAAELFTLIRDAA